MQQGLVLRRTRVSDVVVCFSIDPLVSNRTNARICCISRIKYINFINYSAHLDCPDGTVLMRSAVAARTKVFFFSINLPRSASTANHPLRNACCRIGKGKLDGVLHDGAQKCFHAS